MTKKLLPIGVLIMVVAAAGIYFAVSGGKTPRNELSLETTNEDQAQVTNQGDETVNPSGTYSINELLSMSKPMKCTWKESLTAGGEVTNLIYINGQKFYQDVAMGDVGHAYTVSNGDYLYIWNDFTDAASKIKLAEVKTSPGAKQAKTPDTAGLDQKRDFVCEGWTADNSLFNPPQDKNFKDVTEEMGSAVEGLQENADEYRQQACDLCQKAPTQELIDECLKNAQCDQ